MSQCPHTIRSTHRTHRTLRRGPGALNVKRELRAWPCHGHVYLLAPRKVGQDNLCIMKNEAASWVAGKAGRKMGKSMRTGRAGDQGEGTWWNIANCNENTCWLPQKVTAINCTWNCSARGKVRENEWQRWQSFSTWRFSWRLISLGLGERETCWISNQLELTNVKSLASCW